MTALFKKLNLTRQDRIVVLGAPQSFESELEALSREPGAPRIDRDGQGGPVGFALAFNVSKADLDRRSAELATLAEGDAVLWLAYPKGSSKKYRCDFNRDTGWEVIIAAGFRPVRQVAIDEDWSALRFRRAAFVKP